MPSTMQHSHPLDLKRVSVTDDFWRTEQELVRTEVIPYQWRALNDQVPGADPSYCMHNFKAAAAQNANKEAQGKQFVPPIYTFRGFNALPEDPAHPDPDKFYGFVFQDTDFSKWIEAVGYSLAHHPDVELETTADEAIDIVCAAQLDNGYLDTYYILNGMDRHFTNLKDHHELYCLGHLIEGAVAYYRGTGKSKLLNAACRFAEYVARCFGTEGGKIDGYPGHEIAEMALVKLAEVTGEKKYFDLAAYFVRQRGQEPLYFEREDRARAQAEGYEYQPNINDPKPYAYYQAHEPILSQHEAVGHAVRAVYLYAGVADVARLSGDPDLLNAVRKLWRNIVDKKLYITGGIGATRHGEAFSYNYDLPNDLAYSETCAAIALAFFARRMLEIEPKGEYGDVMETALYNTVLSGMALDGKSFFYVNPLEVRPETAHHRDENFSHVKTVRQKWFGCACCPPNIARLVSSVQEYAYTLADDNNTLFTHLYMSGSVDCELAGVPVTLSMQASLPWSGAGRATLHVSSDSCGNLDQKGSAGAAVAATLAFRLPAWAGGQEAAAAVRVDDRAASRITREIHEGCLYLTGEWHDGDAIVFDFPMPVRMLAANPRVSENVGKVAFARGPITFAAEGHDNDDLLQNLIVDTAAVGADCSGVTAVPFDFVAGAKGVDERGTGEVETVERPMVKLEVPALRMAVEPETADDSPVDAPRTPLYAAWKPVDATSVTATLIPYFAWANRGETQMRVWLNAK